MRLFARHLHHCADPWADATPIELEMREMLTRILVAINRTESEIMIDTTKVTADIAAQTSVLQGLVVFVQSQNSANAALTQQVADLKAALAAAGTPDATTQAALDALDQTVQANTALVANIMPAVTANTPTPAADATAAATAAATPPAAAAPTADAPPAQAAADQPPATPAAEPAADQQPASPPAAQ